MTEQSPTPGRATDLRRRAIGITGTRLRSPVRTPVRTLLTWGGGVAVLSLMLLYILTSVSVVVFFRRTRLDTRPWNTLIAPIASVALLLGATVLALNISPSSSEPRAPPP